MVPLTGTVTVADAEPGEEADADGEADAEVDDDVEVDDEGVVLPDEASGAAAAAHPPRASSAASATAIHPAGRRGRVRRSAAGLVGRGITLIHGTPVVLPRFGFGCHEVLEVSMCHFVRLSGTTWCDRFCPRTAASGPL
jgi:hypothetical protein